jgi:hypothetical protein
MVKEDNINNAIMHNIILLIKKNKEMKRNYLKLAVMAIAVSIVAMSCGSNKQTAKTPQQKAAADRGIKLEAEACEKLSMEKTADWRASGNGLSPKEAFAKNVAELNAKARLARQLEEQINSLIRVFNQQHEAGGVQDFSAKATGIEEGYADQLLTNVKTICSNTYVKEDGSYNVYVCVEMSEQNLSAIHKKLSADKKLSIDFAEHEFKKEMEKAKEEYRNR